MESMIADMAGRMFSEQVTPQTRSRAAQGEWQAALWRLIEDAGLPLALISEEAGGFGVATDEALSIVRIAGAHGVPAPLAETIMANWLAAQAGLPVSAKPQTVVDGTGWTLSKDGEDWMVSGLLNAVPWGRRVRTIGTTVT